MVYTLLNPGFITFGTTSSTLKLSLHRTSIALLSVVAQKYGLANLKSFLDATSTSIHSHVRPKQRNHLNDHKKLKCDLITSDNKHSNLCTMSQTKTTPWLMKMLRRFICRKASCFLYGARQTCFSNYIPFRHNTFSTYIQQNEQGWSLVTLVDNFSHKIFNNEAKNIY